MEKYFCDLCGAPAPKRGSEGPIQVRREYGEEHAKLNPSNTTFKQVRARAVARVHFSIDDHPTGFGGPPDLCDECRLSMIEEMAERFGKLVNPIKHTPPGAAGEGEGTPPPAS